MSCLSISAVRRVVVIAMVATSIGVATHSGAADAPAVDDALAPWRTAMVKPVSDKPDRHTIHSYYVTSPESPDGSHVLLFASTAASGETGDVIFINRATGEEFVAARNVTTEDGHRAACQQWTRGGSAIAYHDVRDGRWGVYVADLRRVRKAGRLTVNGVADERAIALDRQLGFGSPKGNWLPIYGKHWNPGEHRDLVLADAGSGETRKVLTVDAVEKAYEPWVKKQFAGKPISVFFPVMSPDEKRVFFKLAAGNGGENFRSKLASVREGLVAADVETGKLLFMNERWGHPAWFPDSRRIIQVGNLWFDSAEQGKVTRILDLPVLPGGPHPSVSPDGKLFVTDGLLDKLGGKPGEWGIVVGDIRGGEGRYHILHRFDNSQGAKTWRKNHPHPVFSPDGKRIHFNVSDTQWTRMMVAEIGEGK